LLRPLRASPRRPRGRGDPEFRLSSDHRPRAQALPLWPGSSRKTRRRSQPLRRRASPS
jgi:hypothetical protein